MPQPQNAFSDAQSVGRYAEGPIRIVPGFLDLQRMARLLLEEHVGPDGKILIVGAGGGLELNAFASAQPGWMFVGVDPSEEMLAQAAETLGPLTSRVKFVHGYVDEAPQEEFDGATCLLTFHFLTTDVRRKTIAAIRQRLKLGAPFLAAHLSFPQSSKAERDLWLSRYAAFMASSGVALEKARAAASAVDQHLSICTPEQDELLLSEGGFSRIQLFYSAFAFRGWLAHAA
jgi:tRNA (cmo5U34)-methyltransferase